VPDDGVGSVVTTRCPSLTSTMLEAKLFSVKVRKTIQNPIATATSATNAIAFGTSDQPRDGRAPARCRGG